MSSEHKQREMVMCVNNKKKVMGCCHNKKVNGVIPKWREK